MELNWDVYNPDTEAEQILVLGPTLGGNAQHQWTAVAELLSEQALICFVDFPGHGLSPVWDDADEPTLDVVGAAIMQVVAQLRAAYGQLPVTFAGLSISGATALHLARDYPDQLAGVAVLCSAATVGVPERWLERAAAVEVSGTQQLLEETKKRWFTPAFCAQHPTKVAAVMEDLAATDDHSYAQLCRALAAHDLRADLANINCPVLLIAGGRDSSTPSENIELVAESVPGAELRIIEDVAHQASVAAPQQVAELLAGFLMRINRPAQRAQGDD